MSKQKRVSALKKASIASAVEEEERMSVPAVVNKKAGCKRVSFDPRAVSRPIGKSIPDHLKSSLQEPVQEPIVKKRKLLKKKDDEPDGVIPPVGKVLKKQVKKGKDIPDGVAVSKAPTIKPSPPVTSNVITTFAEAKGYSDKQFRNVTEGYRQSGYKLLTHFLKKARLKLSGPHYRECGLKIAEHLQQYGSFLSIWKII